MSTKTYLLCLILTLAFPPHFLAAAQDEEVPKEKGGRMSPGGLARGTGFRVTMIHPMRGDFSRYDKLEIVKMRNLTGERTPQEAMEDYTDRLYEAFHGSGLFRTVRKVETLRLDRPLKRVPVPALRNDLAVWNGDDSGPVGGLDLMIDRSQTARQPASEINGADFSEGTVGGDTTGDGQHTPLDIEPQGTLVIATSALYYKGGNRGLRALGLGFGYHRFIVRFYIFDKEQGLELAMGNISGEVIGSFASIPLIAGDDASRSSIVEAIENRVEVRKALAER